jgi:sugar lactone lactonase YvrE
MAHSGSQTKRSAYPALCKPRGQLNNVWSRGPGGIHIVSPKGQLLGRIQLPVNTNRAFGDDLHSVFFTSGPNIYRLHTIVAGLKPMYYRK